MNVDSVVSPVPPLIPGSETQPPTPQILRPDQPQIKIPTSSRFIAWCFMYFFVPDGRIGRLEFFLVFFSSLFVGALVPWDDSLLLIFAFLLVFHVCILVRRAHDLGKSDKTILLLLVPLLNCIVLFWLFVFPACEENNPYGLPNSNSYRQLFKLSEMTDQRL